MTKPYASHSSPHFIRQQITSFYEELYALTLDKRPVKERYKVLYRLFVELLNRGTAQCQIIFSGPFARMQYLCRQAKVSDAARNSLNLFRLRGRNISERSEEELALHFLYDTRLVAEFAERIYQVPLPPLLASRLPFSVPEVSPAKPTFRYLRAIITNVSPQQRGEVEAITSEYISSSPIRISLKSLSGDFDYSYLLPYLHKGSQINVIHPSEEKGIIFPELLIYEPDYLVDISSIAAGFESYGATPLTALLQKIKPTVHSKAILLGNFASQLLDEAIHTTGKQSRPYKESVQHFFRHYALQLVSCPDMGNDFHVQAQEQIRNLRQIIDTGFKEDDKIEIEHILLEPSFFCEMLGIQGRMDLLQSDLHVLMEQKSGKRSFKGNFHQEKHYVQMLLYLALLHYNFGIKNNDISSYLLYSKYPDGLIRESSSPEMLFRAIKLRNEVVAQEYEMVRDENIGDRLFAITPDGINPKKCGGKLWEQYQRPAIEALLRPMHEASHLERLYFNRLMSFVQKEHILSKVGCSGRETGGMAALWSFTLQEKLESGLIFDNLHITELLCDTDGGGLGSVTLSISDTQTNNLPNFREGDIVVLYSYPLDQEPDIRRRPALRCTITRLLPDRITLRLRAPQRTAELFKIPDRHGWAVEHDYMDSSFQTLYRGIYSFFSATPSRRKLILGQRKPECDWKRDISADYSEGGKNPQFNDLVRRAIRAKDYFLLVGPPGTGKTSFGLMNILRESLVGDTTNILVTAYTNRAVDEICSKLVVAGLNFVRIGSEPACAPIYRPHLLSELLKTCTTTIQVRNLLASTRIITGTLSSLSSSDGLFKLKHFDVAIIDEASQILEPQLLGLLCARNGEGDAIDKFVLIGDYKQLPAVVAQDERDSFVTERELREIGLIDCRRSMFERLLNLQGETSVFQFTFEKQGRMHPEVADFSNKNFYSGILRAVPLPHQRQSQWLRCQEEENGLGHLLAENRMIFMDCPEPGLSSPDKVNEPEAVLIATVAYTLAQLFKENKREFDPLKSLGVIVPYRNQIAMIKRELKKYALPELQQLTIDTVERYQGSERDIIVYGYTVHRLHQLDFLTSNSFQEDGRLIDRKLNVALTRAREQLIMVGSVNLLKNNAMFHSLISYCKGSGAFVNTETSRTFAVSCQP